MVSKITIALSLFALAASAMATEYDQTKFYTISKVEVAEISHDVILDQSVQKTMSEAYLDEGPVTPSRIETAGKVITTARDLVALGEDIYRLVSHGKPNVSTSYDPISVIPKVNNQPVDILDTESWSMPAKRTYSLTLRNTYNIAVITFRYSVIYSYHGSYNGKGAYLTAAQIQPDYVNVLWGFDFTATMKLGGIQNQGTRDNPVAAATLLMQYSASNILNSRTMIDTYFITGRGGFKKL
jgi:hypothetical protein